MFIVKRHGEFDRFEKFKDLHNRMLLWHGSRTSNFAGILSQGLRIAPPEAPVVRSEFFHVARMLGGDIRENGRQFLSFRPVICSAKAFISLTWYRNRLTTVTRTI